MEALFKNRYIVVIRRFSKLIYSLFLRHLPEDQIVLHVSLTEGDTHLSGQNGFLRGSLLRVWERPS